jgi:hypothetical protein
MSKEIKKGHTTPPSPHNHQRRIHIHCQWYEPRRANICDNTWSSIYDNGRASVIPDINIFGAHAGSLWQGVPKYDLFVWAIASRGIYESLFCKTVPKSYLSQIACTKFFLDTLQYTTSIRFHRCNRRHWSDRHQRHDRHGSGTRNIVTP